ncbi:tyrosine-protein phosphatase [Novosphingobium cyanobacteriorum]|uniref:Tyrosine-protein phosphatase n=1 Tax=Novosphingobium cyanobacteriorum TaxID=3024215 RepID=A0ABT6CEA7_9SPHN|nr:tyrosine-protein phosphatase [Novosphingobium cyanobacteriorum]MDF8332256.1 tyrosine-protein phosphatase [Novosphingobium cyanobacteriorum]
MTDRVLDLDGIHNFRDYGGYAAQDGRLRQGLLWRSGQHRGASVNDLAKVHALGLETVIDLRGDSERAANPCLRHDDFGAAVLFHPGETAASNSGRAAHEEWADQVRTVEDARNAMVRLYQGLPFRPVLIGSYRLFFHALAHGRGPSLLHCVAGKDRTGIGAALLHTLLGVHPDDVMSDYLLTNTAGNQESRLAALRSHMSSDGLNEAALRVLMGVEASFLDSAFDEIRQRHGSVERYAEAVLGVDADMRAAIAARLVI